MRIRWDIIITLLLTVLPGSLVMQLAGFPWLQTGYVTSQTSLSTFTSNGQVVTGTGTLPVTVFSNSQGTTITGGNTEGMTTTSGSSSSSSQTSSSTTSTTHTTSSTTTQSSSTTSSTTSHHSKEAELIPNFSLLGVLGSLVLFVNYYRLFMVLGCAAIIALVVLLLHEPKRKR